MTEFCREIVQATQDLAAAYKINFAFFEALGADGWSALERVRSLIPSDTPVLADGKRGDIPSSAGAYARAVFEALDFDAATVSPYLGWDSVMPFARYSGKGVFVLCKTSNPGASQIQDLPVDGKPLYLRIAEGALALHAEADIGLVVGATQPDSLRAVRTLSEDVLILVPGVGAQGAEATVAIRLAGNHLGQNALVTVSREILYASSGRDFADAARAAALRRSRELWLETNPADVHR